jgi:hypothetical protein
VEHFEDDDDDNNDSDNVEDVSVHGSCITGRVPGGQHMVHTIREIVIASARARQRFSQNAGRRESDPKAVAGENGRN